MFVSWIVQYKLTLFSLLYKVYTFILLSVLRLTACDYLFGIFKLIFTNPITIYSIENEKSITTQKTCNQTNNSNPKTPVKDRVIQKVQILSTKFLSVVWSSDQSNIILTRKSCWTHYNRTALQWCHVEITLLKYITVYIVSQTYCDQRTWMAPSLGSLDWNEISSMLMNHMFCLICKTFRFKYNNKYRVKTKIVHQYI